MDRDTRKAVAISRFKALRNDLIYRKKILTQRMRWSRRQRIMKSGGD